MRLQKNKSIGTKIMEKREVHPTKKMGVRAQSPRSSPEKRGRREAESLQVWCHRSDGAHVATLRRLLLSSSFTQLKRNPHGAFLDASPRCTTKRSENISPSFWGNV
jgi:hypothetical protein